MSLMMGSLYNALLRANVPEDVARQAAEEVASHENRIANVERKLDILTRMVGTNIALTVVVLARLLTQ